jgi:hypothetical protein
MMEVSKHDIFGSQYIIKDNKVFNSDGKIGIVYSPGGGTGLTTWSTGIKATDYRLVFGILFGLKMSQIKKVFNFKNLCSGGWGNAIIYWSDPDLKFNIEKKDDTGNEMIVFLK